MYISHILAVSLFPVFAFLPCRQRVSGHEVFSDLSYGPDPEQILDLYMPPGGNGTFSKVLLLLHGGAWTLGSKSYMDRLLPFLNSSFPACPIVNMDYRLATSSSPGYPKQVQDIGLALTFVKGRLGSGAKFTLIGVSAGAHLALLYGYGHDKGKDVQALVNIVGPVDYSDPAYSLNPAYNVIAFSFIGPRLYFLSPEVFTEAGPVSHIRAGSPPTISFYGTLDPLVPASQGRILERYLSRFGVPCELTIFPGGHFDWAEKYMNIMREKIVGFLRKYF